MRALLAAGVLMTSVAGNAAVAVERGITVEAGGTRATGSQAASEKSRPFMARVTRIVDGDTVWLQTAGQPRARWFKVRIEGIDAPEICQPGGEASRTALVARIFDKPVTVSLRGQDDYGRFLGRLAVDGSDVGAAMVSAGQAWSHRFRWHAGPYAAQQARAMAQRRGVFSMANAEQPRDFRKRHGPCPVVVRPGK
ncbi:MAG: thermonuclease family protein [Polaromonas sp.]|nr:thermonuclease family protein [Polaromonas sp.]